MTGRLLMLTFDSDSINSLHFFKTIRSSHGVSLLEFAICLPLLLLLVSGVIDYSLMLRRIELVSLAVREGGRISATATVEDDDNELGVIGRSCPGAHQATPNQLCSAHSGLPLNCSDPAQRDNYVECLAIAAVTQSLTNSGLNTADWVVSPSTCISIESGSPIPIIKINIQRSPGSKLCMWCYLANVGLAVESAQASFRLEGQC